MEQVIERAKNTDGWDIEDVVSSVNGHVSKVLDTHGIEGAAKEKSMEHLDNKLSTTLEEISVAKEFVPAQDAEVMEGKRAQATENEVAAHMEQVIERANSKLAPMLEQISAAKEFEPTQEMERVEEMKPAEDFEGDDNYEPYVEPGGEDVN